jgi:hypothetical protein
MMSIDKSKLIKLLNLTTSSNDHEALQAIRFANKILENNKLTWDDLITINAMTQKAEPYVTHNWDDDLRKETVEDAYDIDVDELYDLTSRGDWYQASYNFYMGVRYKNADDMSFKQRNWLNMIVERLQKVKYG